MKTYKKTYTSLEEPLMIDEYINGIFTRSVHNLNGDLGNKEYVQWLSEGNQPEILSGDPELIEIVKGVPVKTADYDKIVIQRQNTQIEFLRKSRYQQEVDPLTLEYVSTGLINDQLFAELKVKKQQIKNELPYIE